MTTVMLIKIPEPWLIPDEDGSRIVDSFTLGMILDVSTKGTHCRVYTPEDANIPFDCLEYLDGDKHELFSPPRNQTKI